MKAYEHYTAVAASDLRDHRETLFLRDQIGALNALHEATLEPERAEDVASHHDQNIPVDPVVSRLSSPID
jgi:hypothetical protein